MLQHVRIDGITYQAKGRIRYYLIHFAHGEGLQYPHEIDAEMDFIRFLRESNPMLRRKLTVRLVRLKRHHESESEVSRVHIDGLHVCDLEFPYGYKRQRKLWPGTNTTNYFEVHVPNEARLKEHGIDADQLIKEYANQYRNGHQTH